MAKATEKVKDIESLLTAMTGKHRLTEIEADRCISCEKDAKEFKNELSKREYSISGLCQKCQDNVFG